MAAGRSGGRVEILAGQALRLNIGGGDKRLDGWLNVDLDPSADIVADVRALPQEDDSVDEAMAIHVLEHIPRWDAEKTVAEWRRVLKPGARLIVEVPDLLKCCEAILAGKDDRMGMWGLFGDPSYQSELMVHRWAYSGEELAHLLKAAGFSRVRIQPAEFHKRQRRDLRVVGVK